MNSLKTIKIAVLSGLILSSATPIQALTKRDLDGLKAVGLVYGMGFLGAGVGYALSKSKKINAGAQKDNATIENIVQRLENNFVVINDNIDELTSLRQIDRDWIKQQMSAYHESLRFAGQDPKKLKARDTLLEGLKGCQYSLTHRGNTWSLDGALCGLGLGVLSILASNFFKRK
jgi:hypothetical protein